MRPDPRIICVSNRLPVTATTTTSGELEFLPSSGGLVTAMGPVLRMSRGTWIGWPGTVAESNTMVSDALGLSEFAGAADELAGLVVLVNPYDVEGVAKAISSTIALPEEQLRTRMKAIRERLNRSDVFEWARSILKAAGWEWPSLEANPRPLPSTIWERLRKVTRVLEM